MKYWLGLTLISASFETDVSNFWHRSKHVLEFGQAKRNVFTLVGLLGHTMVSGATEHPRQTGAVSNAV